MMRISDWSSDVCSSDLAYSAVVPGLVPGAHWRWRVARTCEVCTLISRERGALYVRVSIERLGRWVPATSAGTTALVWQGRASRSPHRSAGQRSEEHTSELQSLMRISYAVF